MIFIFHLLSFLCETFAPLYKLINPLETITSPSLKPLATTTLFEPYRDRDVLQNGFHFSPHKPVDGWCSQQ